MNLFYKLFHFAALPFVWLLDFVNSHFEPWEDPNRPLDEKYPETLEVKAYKFGEDMKKFHMLDLGIWSYKLPIDTGDQALWHGYNTAMFALKYSVTGAKEDLDRLLDCTDGLYQHQRTTAEAKPRLVRGVDMNGMFEDNVSNDQASGHLLGIYFLYKYGDGHCRWHATRLITGLAEELLSNDMCLINLDGKPTKFGRLVNGFLTDPLNLTLAMATLRLAYKLTNRLEFLMKYQQLADRYFHIIPYANFRVLWNWQTSTGLRAAIHYTILCDLENSHDLHRQFLRGLLRTWSMEKKGLNPSIYFMLRRQVLVDPAMLEKVVNRLKEMTLEDKQTNVEKTNSLDYPTVLWGGHKRARSPIPRWKMGAMDNFDSRHPYSVDDWIGNKTGDTSYSGCDFLFAYWGLKNLRLI